MSRVSEDVYLEVKTRKEELKVDEYFQGKIRAYSFNPVTIDTILTILELKYDLDEDVQAEKRLLIEIMLKMNNRKLMEDYV